MPAFLAMVESEDGYAGDVYFTEHAVTARRAVCDTWQDGEFSGAIVRRIRHFDKYEEQGWVPMTDMAYEGWWSECYHCGKKLTVDVQYDEDNNEFVLDPEDFIGKFGGRVFCHQQCHDEYHDQHNEKAAFRNMVKHRLKMEVTKKFGVQGVTFPEESAYSNIDVSWDTEQNSPRFYHGEIAFDCPNTSGGAMTYRVRNPEEPEDNWNFQFYYNQEQTDAVHAFVKERTGLVLDNPESLS